jgi:hypothetical protein
VTPIRTSFRIGDSNAFEDFVTYTFSTITQKASKDILTVWINDAIQPRKQSTFPYAKQSEQKAAPSMDFDPKRHPDWWPTHKVNGVTKLSVPFIEPNHLKKDERLKLAVHLTMMMDRNRAEMNAKTLGGSGGQQLDINHPFIDLLKVVTDAICRTKLRETNDTEAKYNHRMAILSEFWRVASQREECLGGGLRECYCTVFALIVD